MARLWPTTSSEPLKGRSKHHERCKSTTDVHLRAAHAHPVRNIVHGYTMKKWEYKSIMFFDGYCVQDLNEEGELGWEVVDIRHAQSDRIVLFKRPKKSECYQMDL